MSSGTGEVADRPHGAGKAIGGEGADRRPWIKAALVAALLGVGGLQGYRLAFEDSSSPIVYEAGALVATGRLEQVLYDPALGGREEGPSVGATFTNQAGHSCRRFTDGPVSGMACRRNGDWRVVEMRQD